MLYEVITGPATEGAGPLEVDAEGSPVIVIDQEAHETRPSSYNFV